MSEKKINLLGETADMKKLLKLEELFHNHLLTPVLLNQLISIYVSWIDMLEKENILLKAYFFERMKFILRQKEIIHLLDFGNLSSLSQIEEEEIQPIQIRLERQRRVGNFLMMHQKNESSIGMPSKVMEEVEESINTISKKVAELNLKHEKKHFVKDRMAKSRNDQLHKRLEKRRKKHLKMSAEADEIYFHLNPKIKKQELMEARKTLDEAVQRFTKSTTEKRQSLTLQSENPLEKIKESIQELVHRHLKIETLSIESFEQKHISQSEQKLKSSQYW